MIISEKQIMRLMEIARNYYRIYGQMNGLDEHQKEVAQLLREINNQQSEKLKVIE